MSAFPRSQRVLAAVRQDPDSVLVHCFFSTTSLSSVETVDNEVLEAVPLFSAKGKDNGDTRNPVLLICDFPDCIYSSIPQTPVKVAYLLKHTMCAGLHGKILTEKGQWKKGRNAGLGHGGKKTPV